MKSENLVATPYAAKQKQWADKRVWWYVALARRKVMLHVMPMDYVQNGHGNADFVSKLPGQRFQGAPDAGVRKRTETSSSGLSAGDA